LISTGKLGRIVEFETHFDTHSPVARPGWEETWRTQSGTGSGVLYDLGSHLIDQVLVLFGKPLKVTGFLCHQRPEHSKYGDPDSMTILMHYPDGMLATIKSSIMNAEREQLRYWVRGENAAYKKVRPQGKQQT
jgi:predicted dehydrogenase